MSQLERDAVREAARASEFMQFTGKLLVERSGLGARSTVKENEYFCHCYVRSDGLAAVSVTDGEYQARVAMSMMTRVLDDFSSKVHAVQWAQIKTEKDCLYTSLPELLAKWQNPREADPMTRVQAQIKTEKDCLYTSLPELLAKWQNPREADPMTRVQEEVEETKIVMHNTIQSVLERDMPFSYSTSSLDGYQVLAVAK
ncbi:hypothetical protein TELCIR_03618 [Teladorsagia circumcincta]|uniref:Longin domain-containing protein n=1 Tax=Teladorsagia circumcincta TaxID=45464 RepID=A0A2G9UVV4_TELCI|nr:hypothetical protein TELCIR_03618 [Teladorsagia circumcincta]